MSRNVYLLNRAMADGMSRNCEPDDIEMFCTKWNLEVHIGKTKIVVFTKGGILNRNECWTNAGEDIEIVNSFNHLELY